MNLNLSKITVLASLTLTLVFINIGIHFNGSISKKTLNFHMMSLKAYAQHTTTTTEDSDGCCYEETTKTVWVETQTKHTCSQVEGGTLCTSETIPGHWKTYTYKTEVPCP